MHRIRLGAVALVVLMAGGATFALAGTGGGDERGKRGWGWGPKKWSKVATAKLQNAEGAKVGRVWLHESRRDGKVTVFARVNDVPPGFHGFHIHTVGECVPPFTSTMGHFNPTGASHPDHAGDLPSLLVNADGTGLLAAQTDRFSLSDLRDADGSAVIVHAGRDNFANIPERYLPPPIDQMTLDTGDAGARYACGVVR